MRDFTDQRHKQTVDECWLVEHPPVFTLGQAGKESHILNRSSIPVVKTDRGGQVTYHGPGQVMLYCLLDLKRKKIGVKQLVDQLEQTVIDLLHKYHISAVRKAGAPGVYVDNAKISALGLRVRRGCSYHGLALNMAMDLAPFKDINPCGYPDMQVVNMQGLTAIALDFSSIGKQLIEHFSMRFDCEIEFC